MDNLDTELVKQRYVDAIVRALSNQGIDITDEQALFTLGYLAGELIIAEEED